jgi:hypothetical protein
LLVSSQRRSQAEPGNFLDRKDFPGQTFFPFSSTIPEKIFLEEAKSYSKIHRQKSIYIRRGSDDGNRKSFAKEQNTHS